MDSRHAFARRVFFWAAIYGIAVLVPMYFLEDRLGRDFPPPVSHPEHYYGFVGVALAWQFAFLAISRDVVRYRLLMLPAVLEKLAFALPVLVLFANGRVDAMTLAPALVDLVLAVLFVLAYRATRPAADAGLAQT